MRISILICLQFISRSGILFYLLQWEKRQKSKKKCSSAGGALMFWANIRKVFLLCLIVSNCGILKEHRETNGNIFFPKLNIHQTPLIPLGPRVNLLWLGVFPFDDYLMESSERERENSFASPMREDSVAVYLLPEILFKYFSIKH